MQQLISLLLIICDNVYKENAFAVYDPNLFQFCTYSASHIIVCPPPPTPPPQRDATPRANTAAGYITAGYITGPDAHGDLLVNCI